MLSKDNLVGFLLLGLCAVVAAIMIRAIVTGETISFSAPAPISAVITIAFFALMIFGVWRGPLGRRLRGGQGGQQWPNPGTGQRSLWDRLRGR